MNVRCRLLPVIFGLFFLVSLSSFAQVYSVREGTITFFSETALENIDATNSSIQGILYTSYKTVAFIVPIRKFKFKKDLMEEHFNEKYMESDKFPNATYSGKINEDIDFTKNGTYPVTTSGKLTIHGVERDVTQVGTLRVKDGAIFIETSFPIAIKDYKIEIPKLLFQNIADTVAVTLKVAYQPFKK